MWNIFLTDFKFHLEAKSWLDITYIGINENPMEETLAAIHVVRNHDKCWKITYAGNWHKELDGLLDDYSFLYGEEPVSYTHLYIYGEHDNKSLEAVLNAIQYSTGIRYRKEESRIVLYKTSH